MHDKIKSEIWFYTSYAWNAPTTRVAIGFKAVTEVANEYMLLAQMALLTKNTVVCCLACAPPCQKC